MVIPLSIAGMISVKTYSDALNRSASEKIAQNIAEVNHSAEEMACIPDQVKARADDLQKMSASLSEIVGRFKI